MAEIDDAEAFLAAKKEAVGTASWGEGARPGLIKVEWPIYIGGESTGGRLVVEVATGLNPPQFTIVLLMDKCLGRLDYDVHARHINPMKPPKGVPHGKIEGPHYHTLRDNKRLSERGSVPRDLKFARPLPPARRDLMSCLQWFCELTNIAIRGDQLPSEPEQGRLL